MEEQNIVDPTHNPSIQGAEAGGLLQVGSSLVYIANVPSHQELHSKS